MQLGYNVEFFMTRDEGWQMSQEGHRAELHKVANIDARLAMSIGASFFCFWIVALNMGMLDISPRWFQRQFDWLTNEQVSPLFTVAGTAFLAMAGVIWLFSGNGRHVFDLSPDGVTVHDMLGSDTFPWASFDLLERNVGDIVLHLAVPEGGLLGRKKVVFRLANLDKTGPEIEALIVYYRPDLFSLLHRAGAVSEHEEVIAGGQQIEVAVSQMSPRLAAALRSHSA